MQQAQISRRDALLGLGAVTVATACESAGVVAADTSSADLAEGTTDVAGAVPDVALPLKPLVSVPTDTPAIPPVTPNRYHYVTSCCGTPAVDAATWSIDIEDRGLVLATLTLATLEGIETEDREHTLECIGTGPSSQKISNAVWSGRTLLDVFAAVGVTVPAGATTLVVKAADGFTTGLPIADFDRPLWLVWKMNGETIPEKHGFPARLLVPGRYGMKNPKWITGFEFLETPYEGYWETRGWSDTAIYRPNTFIRDPLAGSTRPSGVVRLVGTAYAGSDPVVAVDVRVDEGPWEPAIIDYAPGADIWTLWHYDWTTTPGAHRFQARCTTESGAMSDENPDMATDLGGYGGSMAIKLVIDAPAADKGGWM